MIKKIVMLLTLLILFLPFSVFAHPGRTDGAGGHYDNSAGEYHYHHGYSAHQHNNGECPYDYEYPSNHTAYKSDNETEIDWDKLLDKAKEKDAETYEKLKEDAQQRASTSSDKEKTQTTTYKTLKRKIKVFIEYTEKHLWIFIIIYFILCILFSYIKEKINSRNKSDSKT